MNEWYKDKKKEVQLFFSDYGKLFFMSLILISFIICLSSLSAIVSSKKLRVSFLDIGQGDSILIQTPGGHDMLIDGGGDLRVLEKIAKELSYFDHHLDVMVATHPDADHITGLVSVLRKYDISHIVISPIDGHTGVFDELQKSISDEHAEVHVGKKGDEIIFGDGVVAHILYPGAIFHGDKKDTNSASVSLVITYGSESILLTGDLPSTHEGELLGEALPHNVTIYKAGHHGSKFSSGEQLLSYIKPEYAVISAGKDNKYGHPNPEALARLAVYSQEIISTIDRGTISFLLDGRTSFLKTTK